MLFVAYVTSLCFPLCSISVFPYYVDLIPGVQSTSATLVLRALRLIRVIRVIGLVLKLGRYSAVRFRACGLVTETISTIGTGMFNTRSNIPAHESKNVFIKKIPASMSSYLEKIRYAIHRS